MPTIRGIPYAPGRCTGKLVAAPNDDPSTVPVLAQDHLAHQHIVPRALIIVDAAPFAHATIRWLAAGIPIILLSKRAAARLPMGKEALIDGDRGAICPPPPPSSQGVEAQESTVSSNHRTHDGVDISFRASVADAHGARKAKGDGADAIGLVRSEFLHSPTARPPTQSDFRDFYSGILAAAAPLDVTIRMVDFSREKHPRWLRQKGMNSPLGLRGAALFNFPPVAAVYHAELEALASLDRTPAMRVIVPEGGTLEEFARWRRQIKDRVGGEVGVMIETPVALMDMDAWDAAADFLSVGCNDLMQCAFGTDRQVAALSPHLDPYHPALFRMLRCGVRRVDTSSHEIQICGLLPQFPGVIRVLVGLGFRRFSVNSAFIRAMTDELSRATLRECQDLAAEVMEMPDSAAVRGRLMEPFENRQSFDA